MRASAKVVQARLELRAEGKRRLARMKRTGVGIPAEEVFAYVNRRAAGIPAVRPKARKIA
jgi:hypothetical protein